MTIPETVTVKRSRLNYKNIWARKVGIEVGYDYTTHGYPNSDKPGLDTITVQNPHKSWETNSIGIGKSAHIEGYRTKPKSNPSEAMGALRLGFGKMEVIPRKESTTNDIQNFIIGESRITGETHIFGNRNLIADKAHVHNSTLNGGCFIANKSRVENSTGENSEICDSTRVVDSDFKRVLVKGDSHLNNVAISYSRIRSGVEIDASAIPDGKLEIYKLYLPAWLIPGNRESWDDWGRAPSREIVRNMRAFTVNYGDVFPYLPHIRACFDPENHRKQTERCHCLIWLPLMLTFSPVALHYLMRVSSNERVITGRDKNFLKDVRENVQSMGISNPLSSVPLKDLESQLEQEYKHLAKFSRLLSPERNLKALGVTDREWETLKMQYDAEIGDTVRQEKFSYIFQHVTGIRLGTYK
jgi:hypothetical protein